MLVYIVLVACGEQVIVGRESLRPAAEARPGSNTGLDSGTADLDGGDGDESDGDDDDDDDDDDESDGDD